MATTVNNAFDEFMKNFVNLDPDKVDTARKSCDNLLTNIYSFSGDDDFFSLKQDKELKLWFFCKTY